MPDYFYVYPAYLAKSGSRALGRRVPASVALDDLTLEQMAKAARTLGFSAEVEAEKQYPRTFYTYAGRIKVTKKPGVVKARFLRELADEILRAKRSGA